MVTFVIGGATALLAVLGSDRVHSIGYKFIIFPAIIGSCIFVTTAVIMNNMSALPSRKYPIYWFPWKRPDEMKDKDDIPYACVSDERAGAVVTKEIVPSVKSLEIEKIENAKNAV